MCEYWDRSSQTTATEPLQWLIMGMMNDDALLRLESNWCKQEMMGGKQFFLLENRRVKFKIRRNDDLNREKFLRYFKYFSALFSLGQS